MATTTDNDDFVDETEIKHEIEEFGDLSETIFDDTKMCNNAEPLENALLAADPDKCGICGEPLMVPRMLFCLHVFCESCLDKKLVGDGGDSATIDTSIVCPTCSHVSKMTQQISDDNNEKNNINKHCLNVGQKFKDYQQLSACVNAFSKQHYHRFVIRTRSQKQVLYKCCHGIKQISKCRGKRPNQHYYYKSCPAQINFYKGKDDKWTLTKIVLNHNHKIGKEEYYGKAKKLKNVYDTATSLLLSGGNSGIIANVLNEKSEKKFIEKDETFTNDFDYSLNKMLSNQEKFNTAHSITKNIAYILSNYGTQTFNKYMEELKVIESNAKNGISLFENKNGFSASEPEYKFKIENRN